MTILQYIIGGLILALAVVLVFLVSKQQGKRKGLENVISGQTSSNSYLNKTEAAKKGKKFEKWTVICAIAFGVLVIALYTVTAISKNVEANNKNNSSAATSSSATSSTVSNISVDTSDEVSEEASVEESAAESSEAAE
ncbi:MAG: preprotein translocase subunit SecG [Ruminococcaceae bacterium]|nr:preprotein translocase subunit SecG [Oscillospiraceae bacterium]